MLLVLLLLASGAAAEPLQEWLTVRDAEAGFVIDLPESPVRGRLSQLTLVGRIHADELIAFLDRTEFRVEVHGIPVLARWILSEDRLLERASDDLLRDEGAVGVEVTPQPHREHPGRRLVYTAKGNRPGEAWFVLAGPRLFLVTALWPAGDSARAGRERFFGSFSLVGDD